MFLNIDLTQFLSILDLGAIVSLQTFLCKKFKLYRKTFVEVYLSLNLILQLNGILSSMPLMLYISTFNLV